jgi:hypothetical protein
MMADITKYSPHCCKLDEVAKSVTSQRLLSQEHIAQ